MFLRVVFHGAKLIHLIPKIGILKVQQERRNRQTSTLLAQAIFEASRAPKIWGALSAKSRSVTGVQEALSAKSRIHKN